MTVFSGLVRRVAFGTERQVRCGLGLLAGIGRELAQPAERVRELERLVAAQGERIALLEERLHAQDGGLRALRGELDSLVAQLNQRLLPHLDERLDDLERDLTVVATGMVRSGKDGDAARARLDTLDRRVTDLRARLAQTEQRAGLWRELQATLAGLGDDIDALRERLGAEPLTHGEAHA